MTKPRRMPPAPNADLHSVARRNATAPYLAEQDISWIHPFYESEQPLPRYRGHPYFIYEDRSPLPVLFDSEGYPVILFEAVVMKRKRRHGWDERTQRRFVATLARMPSVTRAAEAVGLSRRSAYAMLDRPDAEQFAKAWDIAIQFGLDRLRGGSLARCLDGPEEVQVMRKGRHVRTEFRHNDKLAVALLSGQKRDIDHYRRTAQMRWRQKREFDALDAARAAEEAARAAAAADYQRQCEEFIAANTAPRIGPRILRL